MIEVYNLNKSFKLNNDKDIHVLKNINFSLPNSGLYFLYGKSGSGKSTLLSILEGLLSFDSGIVKINGVDIKNIKNKEKEDFYRNNIGILFKNYNLFNDLSIYDNLLITAKIKGINKDTIDFYLKKYNLYSIKNTLCKNISGGEKQRVALIRTILNKPTIVFADEPTGALDSLNSKLLMDELKELSKDSLILVVTHNNKIVEEYSDGSLYLKDGEIIENNIKEEKDKNNYKVYLKRKSEKDYSSLFLKNNLKKNKTKNIISFISLSFGLFIILLSIGFYFGFNNGIDSLYTNLINNNVFKISKNKYETSSVGNLSLVKKELPSKEDSTIFLNKFDILTFKEDLSYFIKDSISFNIDNKKIDCISYKFYYNDSDKNKIILNQEANEIIKSSVNDFYDFKLEKKVNFYNANKKEYIEDELILDFTFQIKEIKNEFKYLNEAKIYLPYDYFKDILTKTNASKISENIGKQVSFFDLLKFYNGNEDICSYSLYFLIKEKDITKMKSFINEINNTKSPLYKVENDDYYILDSFKDMSKALFLGLRVFIIMIALCNVFLISFLVYSTLRKNKRNISILRVIGSKEEHINNIFINEQLFIFLIAALISLIMFFITKTILNPYLFNYFTLNNAINIDIINLTLVILVSLFILFLSCYIPLYYSKKVDIIKELKEE